MYYVGAISLQGKGQFWSTYLQCSLSSKFFNHLLQSFLFLWLLIYIPSQSMRTVNLLLALSTIAATNFVWCLFYWNLVPRCFILHLFRNRTFCESGTDLSRTTFPSCHSTNNVKAGKITHWHCGHLLLNSCGKWHYCVYASFQIPVPSPFVIVTGWRS